MRPFPKPQRPEDGYWKTQEASMREAAKEEYIRLLHIGRKIGKLRVVEISRPGFATFYDVQYESRVCDPKRPAIKFETMSVMAFIKKKHADAFRDFALSDREIPQPPSKMKRERHDV